MGWQGLSHLTGGFSTVLAVGKRNLDGSECCEQNSSPPVPVAGPDQD